LANDDPHRLRNFSTYPFPCPDCGTSVAAGTIHTFPECVAALKARGCDGCEHWVEGVQRTCNANVAVFPDEASQDYDEPPSDFACNRYQRSETP